MILLIQLSEKREGKTSLFSLHLLTNLKLIIMSKIYWTDATGKKWRVKDMSERHINNILSKLSKQDIMSCVAFMQMQAVKQKKAKTEIRLNGEIAQDLYSQGMIDEMSRDFGFDPDNPYDERG